MRGRHIALEDTICSVCIHQGHGYLSCSCIGPVLQKQNEFQANQWDCRNEVALSTTPLLVVETMEESEIRNARIAPITPWNTAVSAPPAPQLGPNNYTSAAFTARSQSQSKKWDSSKPTPINTNLLYSRRLCAFSKKFDHKVQTCTNDCETLNDFNNWIQSSLNNIIENGGVTNGWEDRDKDFFIAQWIDQETGM